MGMERERQQNDSLADAHSLMCGAAFAACSHARSSTPAATSGARATGTPTSACRSLHFAALSLSAIPAAFPQPFHMPFLDRPLPFHCGPAGAGAAVRARRRRARRRRRRQLPPVQVSPMACSCMALHCLVAYSCTPMPEDLQLHCTASPLQCPIAYGCTASPPSLYCPSLPALPHLPLSAPLSCTALHVGWTDTAAANTGRRRHRPSCHLPPVSARPLRVHCASTHQSRAAAERCELAPTRYRVHGRAQGR